MTDLDRAIAAAREASARYEAASDADGATTFQAYNCMAYLRDLLAALDAARGEAVAWVAFRDGVKCGALLDERSAKALCGDDPRFTYCATYAAPPAMSKSTAKRVAALKAAEQAPPAALAVPESNHE